MASSMSPQVALPTTTTTTTTTAASPLFDRFSLLQAVALQARQQQQTPVGEYSPLDLSQKSSRKASEYKPYKEEYEEEEEEEELGERGGEGEGSCQGDDELVSEQPTNGKDSPFSFPSVYMSFYNTLRSQMAATPGRDR